MHSDDLLTENRANDKFKQWGNWFCYLSSEIGLLFAAPEPIPQKMTAGLRP